MKRIFLIIILLSICLLSKARYDAPYYQDSLLIIKEDYFKGIEKIFPKYLFQDSNLYISYKSHRFKLDKHRDIFDNYYKTGKTDFEFNSGRESIIDKIRIGSNYEFEYEWTTAIESNYEFCGGDPPITIQDDQLIVYRHPFFTVDINRPSSQLTSLDLNNGKMSDSTSTAIALLHWNEKNTKDYIFNLGSAFFINDLTKNSQPVQDISTYHPVLAKYDKDLNLVWRKYVTNHENKDKYPINLNIIGDSIFSFSYSRLNDENNSITTTIHSEITDFNGNVILSEPLFTGTNFSTPLFRAEFPSDFDSKGNFYLLGYKNDSNYFKEYYPELPIHNSNMLLKFNKKGDFLWEKVVDFDYDSTKKNYFGSVWDREYLEMQIDENDNIILYGRRIDYDKNLKNIFISDSTEGHLIKIFNSDGDFISNIYLHHQIADLDQVVALPRQKYLLTGEFDPLSIPKEYDRDGQELTSYFIIGLPDLNITSFQSKICSGTRARIEYDLFPEESINSFLIEVSNENGTFENSTTFITDYDDYNTVFFDVPDDLYGERKIRLISNDIDTYSDIYHTSITFSKSPECKVLEQTELACLGREYTYKTEEGFSDIWGVMGGNIIGNNRADSVKVVWNKIGNGTLRLKQTSKSGCENVVEYTIKIEAEPEFLRLEDDPSFCDNGASKTLSLFEPKGGNYYGEGIEDNYIDPSNLNPGNYSGTYTYTFGDDCFSNTFFSYKINGSPEKPEIQEESGKLFVDSEEKVFWYLEEDLNNLLFEAKEFEPDFSGKFIAQIENENGCESEYSEPYNLILSILNNKDLNVEINGKTIKINSNKLITELSIYDLQGKQLIEKSNINYLVFEFPTTGVYFIKINNKIYKHKL